MVDSHINKRCLQTEQSLLFYGRHSNGRRYEEMQIEVLFLSGNIALYEQEVVVIYLCALFVRIPTYTYVYTYEINILTNIALYHFIVRLRE